jgi:pyrroloquinoline-quinone synthase
MELETALREAGAEGYHDLHPTHDLLHECKIRRAGPGSALNRYCYQAAIPRHNASLIKTPR